MTESEGGIAAGRSAVQLAARAVLVAALAAALLAACVASASAVIVRLDSGHVLSYQPRLHSKQERAARHGAAGLDPVFSNLDYSGGPVMASNTNYAVYWAPAGAPLYPADYQLGVDRYFEDLAADSGGHANVDSVATQYNDASGQFANYDSHFGGAVIDTDPYPPSGCTRAPICLTDGQIHTELTRLVAADGLPVDLAHMYFVLTPPGVESCFERKGRECSAGSTAAVYCAYHGNFALNGSQLIYADDPYVTGNASCDDGNHPNGSSDGVLAGGLSHEHVEALTDPEPNNAWTDLGPSGGEIGDKCGGEMGGALGTALNGAFYNQVVNGHFYWYQEEWSNQSSRCLQRFTLSGSAPSATFTSQREAGNQASFDASGSSAAGGVARYDWQFNDGRVPVETSSPTISHVFPAGGFYLVALTVFAPDGASIGAAQTVVAGTPPPPSVKRVSARKGPATGGMAVTITGSNFMQIADVRFGSVSASSFTLNSLSSISAVVPTGQPGVVHVTVTTPWGSSAVSKHDHFRYIGLPQRRRHHR